MLYSSRKVYECMHLAYVCIGMGCLVSERTPNLFGDPEHSLCARNFINQIFINKNLLKPSFSWKTVLLSGDTCPDCLHENRSVHSVRLVLVWHFVLVCHFQHFHIVVIFFHGFHRHLCIEVRSAWNVVTANILDCYWFIFQNIDCNVFFFLWL